MTGSKNAGWAVALLALPLALLGQQGARVDESGSPTVLYVDQQSTNAADTNAGVQDAPLKTIGKAAQRAEAINAKNIGVKIMVAPGIYREAVTLKSTPPAVSAPIVIEATKKGEAVVSGSEVWTGWESQGNGRVYVHPWPYKWGLAPYPANWEGSVVLKPVVRRREMIFVNDKILRQVMSVSELAESTFYVSEEEENIRMWPPVGFDAKTAVIEVGIRPGLLQVQGRKNLVVRGLKFVHANTAVQGEAVAFNNCSNVVVEDCRFDWNNWSGLGFGSCRSVTVRRSTASHNGAMGMTCGQQQNVFYEDVEASYNNWRGFWGGFTGWAVAGFKQLRVHDALYRRIKAVGNQTGAFWFDFDCANVTIEDALFSQNETRGIFIEASQGPVTLKHCIIAFNRGTGVLSTNSKRVSLVDNIIYGNSGPQIQLSGQLDRPVVNWETKEPMKLNPEQWLVQSNVVVGSNPKQALVDLSGATVERFMAGVKSGRNLWYDPKRMDVFRIGGLNLDLEHWQKVSGQDLDSMVADPQFESPDKSNFELRAGSPLQQRNDWATRTVVRGSLGDLKESLLQEVKENWAAPYPAAAQARNSQWTEVNLRPFANRPLTGPDGWIGEHPLENFGPGEKKIHAVPFQIIDPEANGGFVALALHSARVSQTRGKALPGEIVVPIGQRSAALYFLYGCAYAVHQQVCEFQIVYQDGSKQTIGILPLGKGSKDADVLDQLTRESNIQDWWPTLPQFDNENAKKVMVVSPGNALDSVRYLYTLQWTNPRPADPIKEVRMVADSQTETSLQVLGISVLAPPE